MKVCLCLLWIVGAFPSLLLAQVLPYDLHINTYEQPAKATHSIQIHNGLSVPAGRTFVGEIISPAPPLPQEPLSLRVSSSIDIYVGDKATLSASAEPLRGNSLYLDGVNDYVNIGAVTEYSFERTSTFTIEAWVRTSSASQQIIFSKMLNSGNYRGYNMFMQNGQIHVQLRNSHPSNYLQETTTRAFHDGTWHHIAWSYNGNSDESGSKIYVDGQEQETTTTANTLSATMVEASAPVQIGTREKTLFFKGEIDEVRIWNKERTDTEIASGYKQVIDPASSGLIGYYRFDEALNTHLVLDISAKVAPATGNQGTLYNGPVRSKASHDHLQQARTFSWSLVSNSTVLSSTHTLEIGPFTTGNETHTYRVSSPGYGTTIETADVEVHVLNPHDPITSTPGGSSSYNYITTNTVLVGGITTEEQLSSSLSVDEMSQQTTYFDGLGRPMQVVTRQASSELYDLVQPIEYDAFGREVIKYLPYVNTNGVSGAFQTGATTAQDIFYNGVDDEDPTDGFKNAGPAFSETLFEASPLNRVLEQGAPGSDWQIDRENGEPTFEGNTIKIRERTNEANEVRKWEYTFDDEDTPAENDACAKSSGYYDFIAGKGELFVVETEDENRNLVREYKDKQGRVVCKKVQDGVSAGAPTFAETHYIYDDFGYLRFVVPPQAVENLSSENYRLEYGNSFCKKWLFAYLYDAKGRMSEKRVPGAEPVYMVYNGRDELILTQDGRQRIGYKEDDGSNMRPGDEWSFTKYDALGRVVMTGLLKQGSATEVSQKAMQALVDIYEAEGKDTPTTTDDNYLYEQLSTATGSIEGYSSRAFPATVGTAGTETLYGVAQLEILSVNYYDSYEKAPTTVDLDYERPTTEFEATESDFIRGKATVSKVRVLYSDPVQWLYTVSYYDDKSRVIQVASSNHTGGVDRISSRYDFAGKVLETITVHHNELDPTRDELIVKERSVYDHMGRVMESYQRIGNQREERLSKIEYNAIGELITKKVGVKNVQETPLQEMNFDYNIRGWLTKLNKLTDNLSNTQASDLFAMELSYTRDGANRQYNGNITSMEWKTGSDNVQRKYEYQYDAMNRITHGLYSNNETASGTYYGENFSLGSSSAPGMSYDKNGNILSMKRYGFISQAQGYKMIDNLDYNTATAYNGNQLQGVIDNSDQQGAGDDFDYAHTGVDYIYDEAGNMEEDLNKGIYVHYNHLNLPSRIEFSGDRSILYRYDASGRKLEKQVRENDALIKQTHYLGQFFYEDEVEAAQLQFVSTSEGRALDPNQVGGEQFAYEYSYKDHLGNLRVSFRQGETYQYEAGMEAYRAVEENLLFANVSTTLATDGTARTGKQSSKLHAGTGGKVLGPWKTIRVTKGDVITAKTYGLYKEEADQSTNKNLNAYLTTTGAPTTNSNGAESGNKLPLLINFTVGFSPSPTQTDTDVPNAYLKYIFYDDTDQGVEQGVDLLTETAKFPGGGWEELSLTFTAKKDGYLQVLVANESVEPVYFDDILIIQEKGLISQENHYDPFGLNLTGIEKEGQPDNLFQYNGIEKQEEFGLNWDMADFRSYDPQLGRWHQIDPINKENFSPYAWVTNNPLLYSDPFGLDSLNSKDKNFSWNNVKPGDFVDGTQVLDQVTVTGKKEDNNSDDSQSQASNNMLSLTGLHEKTTNNQAGIVLPIMGALELFELLVGSGIIAGTISHGNSSENDNEHYVYEIISYPIGAVPDFSKKSTYATEKYGIAGDKDHPERRPLYQVNNFNRHLSPTTGRIYDYRILNTGIPGKTTASVVEKFYVTMYSIRNNGAVPNMQGRPKPWKIRKTK